VILADDVWMSITDWSQGRFPGPLSAELAEIIGARRALDMVMTEEKVDAAECVRIGLADEVVPPRDLAKVANEAAALTGAGEAALAAARGAWATRLGTRHH
jgi:enoyl-CoA hydratase/carnithine racemase